MHSQCLQLQVNHSFPFVQVELSLFISCTFISTVGSNQPFIHISGPSFNDTLIFQSNGSQILHITDTIHDDIIALEDVEIYFIQFVNPNPDPRDNPYVRIGNDTLISIVSDDSELNVKLKLLYMRTLSYIIITLSFVTKL